MDNEKADTLPAPPALPSTSELERMFVAFKEHLDMHMSALRDHMDGQFSVLHSEAVTQRAEVEELRHKLSMRPCMSDNGDGSGCKRDD